MKELAIALWALLWALIVSVALLPVGFVYNLLYGIWLSKRARKGNRWTAIFRFVWRIIDGVCAAIGHTIYEFAYGWDLSWNVVGGEFLEDCITAKEDTTFTEKNVSVSASVGKLEIDNDLNKTGKWFSKALNFAFGQKQHARDAWNYLQARNKLKAQYFEPRK